MFASWRNSAYGPIGLDLGTHSIKMLQCVRSAQGWEATAAALLPVPAGLPEDGKERVEALARLVRQMHAGGGFVGKRVVSCLPCEAVHYKNLRMPKMPPEELAAAVGWEAADRFKVGPESLRVQYFDAGEVQQGQEKRQEIIVMAATTAEIEEHVQTLLRSDLRPDAIDVTPSALARAICSGGSAELPKMILDIGYSTSKILIVQQGEVAFFKVIEIGGQRLDQTVAQTLSLALPDAAGLRRRLQNTLPSEAGNASTEAARFGTPRENIERAIAEAVQSAAGDLAKEIGLCLRYYSVTFRGKRPEALTLVGGEAHTPHMARIIAESAGVRVEQMTLLGSLDMSVIAQRGLAQGDLSQWAVVMGLALRTEAAQQNRSAA